MAQAFHRKRPLNRGAGARDVIEGELEDAERGVLRSLLEQTRLLLASAEASGPEPGGPPAQEDCFEAMVASATAALDGPGDDPALHRLLPDAHRDDPLASAEFRRRAGGQVRAGKLARIDSAIACLDGADAHGRIVLDPVQASALVVALTDVRLVLGQRLGLDTDEDVEEIERELAHASDEDVEEIERELAHASDDDPRLPLVLAYDFTTWLQEGLAQSLLP